MSKDVVSKLALKSAAIVRPTIPAPKTAIFMCSIFTEAKINFTAMIQEKQNKKPFAYCTKGLIKNLYAHYCLINSTRLFSALPSAVLLSPIGFVSPFPSVLNRPWFIPNSFTKQFLIALALFWKVQYWQHPIHHYRYGLQ